VHLGRRRRFASEGSLEADDPSVQLGWNPYLVAKATFKLADSQPCCMSEVGYSNTSGAQEYLRCGVGNGADGIVSAVEAERQPPVPERLLCSRQFDSSSFRSWAAFCQFA
jgi:hypothetical protein